ncbi:MAG: pirin family protein [Burkholderiaceae bacterium]
MIEVTERPQVRRSADRGYAAHGWLKSFHSFSFAEYDDPAHVHFGPLRVINEDFIAADSGFGTHGHRDMEIITYVLEGELTHKDSMSSGGDQGAKIRPGDVQRMSAGSGVLHSEFNGSNDKPVHLLQIWIMPNVHGIKPSYEEKRFSDEDKRGRLRLVASNDGRDGSVLIHADAAMYAGRFDGAETATYRVPAGRKAYIHVARGSVIVDGMMLETGDALKVEAVGDLVIEAGRESEILLFDLGQ